MRSTRTRARAPTGPLGPVPCCAPRWRSDFREAQRGVDSQERRGTPARRASLTPQVESPWHTALRPEWAPPKRPQEQRAHARFGSVYCGLVCRLVCGYVRPLLFSALGPAQWRRRRGAYPPARPRSREARLGRHEAHLDHRSDHGREDDSARGELGAGLRVAVRGTAHAGFREAPRTVWLQRACRRDGAPFLLLAAYSAHALGAGVVPTSVFALTSVRTLPCRYSGPSVRERGLGSQVERNPKHWKQGVERTAGGLVDFKSRSVCAFRCSADRAGPNLGIRGKASTLPRAFS